MKGRLGPVKGFLSSVSLFLDSFALKKHCSVPEILQLTSEAKGLSLGSAPEPDSLGSNCQSYSVRPWARNGTSLGVSFLVRKMGVITIAPAPCSGRDDVEERCMEGPGHRTWHTRALSENWPWISLMSIQTGSHQRIFSGKSPGF